jgi:hypothetical protein
MNARLFMLGIGIAIGYVVGARDGRERYNQMKAKVTELWESPRVTTARTSVEDYARTQGPILRDRAEAVAKATPGFVAHTAKDVAESARNAAESAKDSAKDFAGSAKESAKEFADRASTSAREVVGRVTHTATDVRENASRTAMELRERGESAIDHAFTSAGKARDEALAPLDDADDADDDEPEPSVTTPQK